MKWKWLYSVSQCTCNISPWAIIVLPDTVTLISTSSLLSAVFPSAWPASANTVFESVCVHVCACVFTAYCPVCFQVCELASRHSVVWRQRPAIASAIEKEPHCRRIRVEMRGISLPGQATKPNCSWSTGAIQLPVGYIHLACVSISLFSCGELLTAKCVC